MQVSGKPLREQRVIIFGSGTAGIGNADQIRAAMIAEGLSKEEATQHFWCVDIQGLLIDDMGNALRDFQVPYARGASEVSSWTHDMPNGGISLAEVVRQVHPTTQLAHRLLRGPSPKPLSKTWRLMPIVPSFFHSPIPPA